MFMCLFDFFEQADDLAQKYVDTLEEVLPEDLGLDRRAGYRLWIGEDVIAVPVNADGSLQYYGGFEYVEKQYRNQIGSWVFYSSEAGRVQDCLDRFYEKEDDND